MSSSINTPKAQLSVEFAGVKFKNPIVAASGAFGYGREYEEFFPLSILGGIAVKGTSIESRDGNKPPRIAETASGMLNSVGLQNPGINSFIENELPFLKQKNTVVIANIAGKTAEEYREVAQRLDATSVDMVELNISCPNVKAGGIAFGVTCEGAAEITKIVRSSSKKPLMVKLSPNVTNIADIAKAVESEGADAVSLINTLLGMRIDIKTARPILKNNVGGLSGPAVFPVALRMVWQVAGAVKIPVCGIGGISSWEDTVEMMMAGAKIVQIGTALFSNPNIPAEIIEGLEKYAHDNGLGHLQDIAGAVKPW
ncbi:MAG: dihydroorotate dehydrogenase [Oscillospiraceae bacterium]|nr:dihydroorotate dehydrogenase [Oscillospiraceae bacterium]